MKSGRGQPDFMFLLFSIVDKFSIPFLNSATGAISFNTAFA
jgi:hypothetical protein